MANFDSVYTFIARDKFSGIATKLTKKNGQFNRSIKKMNSSLLKFRKRLDKSARSSFSLKKEIKQLIVGFLGFAAISNVADKVLDFEDALLNLSAISGATGKDLNFLKDASFELGKTFGRSGAETLTAFKLVASAKPELLKNLPALKAVTKEVLTLAAASGLELAPAAKAVAGSLNIFNVGADQAARFINVLGAGAKFGSSEIEQTAEAIKKVGPVAFSAGLSFEQLNAAIQVVAKGSIFAEQTGTALRGILLSLQKEGFDFRKTSLSEVFQQVNKDLSRFNSVAALATEKERLFGRENIAVAEGMLLRAASLDVMTDTLTGTNTTTEQATIIMASFRTALARVGTAIEEKIIKNAGPLGGVIKGMTEGLQNFLDSFSEDELFGFNALLTVMASILGAIAITFGILIKLIAKFLSGLVKVGKFIGLTAAKFVLGDAIDFDKELKAINFNADLNLKSLVGFIDSDASPGTAGNGIMEVLGGVKNETVVTIKDPGKQVDKVESSTTPLAPRGTSFKQGSNMVPAT